MLGRSLGLTISCALGASAFLLPPGVPVDKNAALPFAAIDPKHQLLELPCPTCTSLESDSTERSGSSNLLLNLTISKDGQALLLNQEQLYPYGYGSEDVYHDWHVPQISDATTRAQLDAGVYQSVPHYITSHESRISPIEVLTPDGDGIITIKWNLLALDHQMTPVDEVAIQLLRTGDGDLLILSADVVPSTEDFFTIKPFFPIDAPKRPSDECKYLPGPLCKMSNLMGSKLQGLKNSRPGCGGAKKFDSFAGRLPTHIKPHFQPSDDMSDAHFRPQHDRPHGHHHHHHHGMFHAIARGIRAILVPVILGIGVGLIVVPLGLLTGRFIGWLWFNVIRGGKRGDSRARCELVDESAAFIDHKSEDSDENVEPLPLYEDAPAYAETEKEAL